MRPEDVELLLQSRGRDLLRFGYQLTHDHASAQDLVQDAALRLLQYTVNVKVRSPFAYARMVMVRISQDQAGSSRARNELLEDPPDSLNIEQDQAGLITDRASLWYLLGQLSERSRTILVLRYYADMTDKQIAEHLDCPRGTVRSTVSRAIHELQELLNPAKGASHDR